MRAAGFVTSLAPTTRATSQRSNSGLISSISLSWGYGTLASASSTFMWPGIRPATGWIAYFTSTPARLEELGELADLVLGLGDGEAVARAR